MMGQSKTKSWKKIQKTQRNCGAIIITCCFCCGGHLRILFYYYVDAICQNIQKKQTMKYYTGFPFIHSDHTISDLSASYFL